MAQSRSTLITVDRDKFDFVNNVEDRNAVLDQIEGKLVELGKLAPQRFEAIKAARQTNA